MRIRELRYFEMPIACDLVRYNWGDEAAERARGQIHEYFKGGPYAPVFFVADIGGPGLVKIAGFAAYCPSMIMKDAYDLIWIAIDKKYQGQDIGRRLTDHRLVEIVKRGGKMVSLLTQKPGYFKKFGFEVAREMDSWHLMVLKFEPLEI